MIKVYGLTVLQGFDGVKSIREANNRKQLKNKNNHESYK